MRTLDEIVCAVRSGKPVGLDEYRYAVVAFDVLLSQLELEKDPKRLQIFMTAAINSPKEFAGPANDPEDPEVRGWYKAMHGVGNVDSIT